MSDEMNINQGAVQGQNFYTQPEQAELGATQKTTQPPISDTPADSIQAAQQIINGRAEALAVPNQATIPQLNKPDTEQIGNNPFAQVSEAPQPGSPSYSAMLQAFIPPGGTPDQGAEFYSEFLAQFPQGSPENQAMLGVLNGQFTDPNLPANLELFSQAREQIIQSGALAESMGEGLIVAPGSAKASKTAKGEGAAKTATSGAAASTENMTEAEIAAFIQANPGEAAKIADEALPNALSLSAMPGGMDASKGLKVAGSVEEWMVNAENLIKGLPDSAEKDTMLTFLSKISSALKEFTELLYILQTTDSEKTREYTAAKLDETMDKIEKQRKAMRKQIKAAKKGKKKKKMGVMGKILQGITVTMLLVVGALMMCCIPLGTMLVGPIMLAMAADMIMKMAGEEKGVWGNLFDQIDAVVGKTLKAMGASDKVIDGMQIATKALIAAFVISAMLVTGVWLLGGSEVIKSMLFDSGLVTHPIAKMVIGLTLDVTVMIVQITIAIAFMFIPGGQFVGAAMIAAVGANLIKAIQVTATIVSTILTITMTLVSIADSANKVELGRIKMILNRQLANLEEDVKLKELLIDLLKKMIKSLQESIQSLSSTLSEVVGSFNKMMTKLESEMHKLFQALGA